MKRNKIILYIVFLIVVFLPFFIIKTQTPSHRNLQKNKCFHSGFIEAKNGSQIEINLVWGDLFRPKQSHRDMGFDLVGISCYFDPITIEGRDLLPTNPLLNSAITESLHSKDETIYLVNHIFEALNNSKKVIMCFMNQPKDMVCEGDQIVPYCWNALSESRMVKDHGIKYLAALPLFNPDLLTNSISEKETRSRLANNVEAVVRRLINFAADKLHPTVRSIGLAAIGSTSHRGGDSKYFLEFSDGFQAILKGIEKSRPSDSLDRIYLVAYNKHTGLYKEDVLNGLQKAHQYLFLKKLKKGDFAKLVAGSLTVLYFLFCLLSYQNYKQIISQKNRFTFIGSIIGMAATAVSLSWIGSIYISESFMPDSTSFFLTIYFFLAVFCLTGIRWMGKHITFSAG